MGAPRQRGSGGDVAGVGVTEAGRPRTERLRAESWLSLSPGFPWGKVRLLHLLHLFP